MSLAKALSVEREEESSSEAHDAQWYEEAAELYLDLLGAKDDPNLYSILIGNVCAWIGNDSRRQAIYGRVQAAWNGFEAGANDPQLVKIRGEALDIVLRAAHIYPRRLSAMGWWSLVWVMIVLLLMVPVSMLIVGSRSEADIEKIYRSGIAETRSVILEDKTRLTLDAKSGVSVRYYSNERHIQLTSGQAYFQVEHDAARPFVVEVEGHVIQVLGTTFNVEIVSDQVRVTLVDGRISTAMVPDKVPARLAMLREESAWELGPGQQLIISTDELTGLHKVSIHNVDIERELGWIGGRLNLDGEILDVAVNRMNRYSRERIRIEDDGIKYLPIRGSFSTGDTEGFLEALRSQLDVEAERGLMNRITLTAGEREESSQAGAQSTSDT